MMNNDPAVLFYTSDFLTGVMDMTMEERGQYITLLAYQHQKGHIAVKTIRLLVGNVSDNVLSHFKIDEEGLYFNQRMDIEKEARRKFTESRRKNGKKGGRPNKASGKPNGKAKENHMGNEDDNENINIYIKIIIEYLNKKTNSKFKYTSKTTQEKIIARFNDGFKKEDFITVINNKYADWHNTEFEKYLCPETLFGPKFEKYLNQKNVTSKVDVSKNPAWLNQNIVKSNTTEEEKKELENMLSQFKED